MDDTEIRQELFYWLKAQSVFNGNIFSRNELTSGFTYKGNLITLVGPTGIWIPKGFKVPISITSKNGGPYDDEIGEDGYLKYKYRGANPNHRDNIGLKEAMLRKIPLVYFHNIKPNKYIACWPVYIMENFEDELFVRVLINPPISVDTFEVENSANSITAIRRYISIITKQRLHQAEFREYVLSAYNYHCTLCNIHHTELLDAAHIIPDSEPDGEPVINNGLSLCKIHHAAYDTNIIGISPDYTIKVRKDILDEIDGPMLKYGLQSLEGNKLILPKLESEYPDKNRLDRRYQKFLSA